MFININIAQITNNSNTSHFGEKMTLSTPKSDKLTLSFDVVFPHKIKTKSIERKPTEMK